MPARPKSKSAQPSPFHELEQRIGYTFADPVLLRLALTHRSHTYEAANGPSDSALHPNDAHHRNLPGTDNEQLEFLGDAVLGLLVTEALLREFPTCSEGELTRLRAALVSRARMAEFGRALALGDHILLGRGVEQTFGRTRPALLANAAEALLAAIFLDSQQAAQQTGRQVAQQRTQLSGTADPLAVLRPLLQKHLLTPDLPQLRAALAEAPHRGALRDSKTLLQELVQAQNGTQPAGKLRYRDLDQTGPPHDRTFTVQVELLELQRPEAEPLLLATGTGRSKKEAQQAAATLALASWPNPAPAPSTEPAPADVPA